MSIMATMYVKPYGRQEPLEIVNIFPEDEAWLKANGAVITAEECGDMMAIYASLHQLEPEDEALELSHGRSCEETMAALVRQCKRKLEFAE